MDDILTDEQMVGGRPHDDDTDILSDDDMMGGRPVPSSGRAGAFARGAAEGLFPTVGGLGVGLGTGALATAATGNPLVGLGAGLVTGLGAGEVVNRGQDWLMEKMGLREGEGNFSRAQQLADEVEHPYLKAVGAAAPSALLLKPTGAMLQRGVGAAIGGGVSAADEFIRDGEIDPGKVAIGAATGFALPTANRAGAAIEAAGSRAGARAAPYVPESLKRAPQAPPPPEAPIPMADDITMGDGSTRAQEEEIVRRMGARPQLEGPSENNRPPMDGEILPPDRPLQPHDGQGGETFDLDPSQYVDQTPPDTSGLQVNARTLEWRHNVDTAVYQLDKAFPEAKPFWQEALNHAQRQLDMWENHGQGKADPNSHTDASQGPDSAVHQFTPADADRANDLTTTSFGTAQEQPRAARVITSGNPVGAQMAAREAAHTSSLLRNYSKERSLFETTAYDGRPKIDVDRPESPIAEDIQAALRAIEPPRPEPARHVAPEVPKQVEPTTPEAPRAPEAPHPTEPSNIPGVENDPSNWLHTLSREKRTGLEGDILPPAKMQAPDEGPTNARGYATNDLHPSEYQDITGQRALPKPAPEVTGAVTPRPTLSIKNSQPRSAKDLKFSRGTREVVPEKFVPAETPTDKYAPVDAPKTKPEAVFSSKEEANLLQKIADMPRENENLRTGKYRNAKQVGEKVVQLGRGDVGKRRLAALDAFTDAAKEMPKAEFKLDFTKETSAAALDHATKLVENAQRHFVANAKELKVEIKGSHPTERGVGYTPNEKPPEFTIVEAARKAVNNPIPKNISKYIDALASEGKNIVKEDYTGKDSHKVEFTDAVEANLQPSVGRTEPQPRKPTGDEGFDRAQRELERWVDNLTNDQWAAMDSYHEGTLADTVKTTHNPEIALAQFRNDLSNIRVRPGRSIDTERAPEEVAPDASKPTPDSEAGKAELAKLMGEQKADIEADTENSRPIDKGIMGALHDFLYEDIGEGGWLDVGRIGSDLKALYNRLMASAAPTPKTAPAGAHAAPHAAPAAPAAPTVAHVQAAVQHTHKGAMEYGREVIQPWFTRLNARVDALKFELRAEVSAIVSDKTVPMPTRAEFEEGFHAREARKPLQPKFQAWWDKYGQPRYDALKVDAAANLAFARGLKIPGWEKLKDLNTNGAGFADYMPHTTNKEIMPQRETDVVSNSLSGFNPHNQTRTLFSLQNLATGERLLYKVDPDDASHITILRNGAPQKVAVVGKPDMAEIGTDIPLTVKGVKGTWRVDHGTVQEIRANAGRNPDGTPKVDFIDNPEMAMMAAQISTKLTLERMRMLNSLINDPRFTKWITKDKATAEANGWFNQPKGENWVKHKTLPQFEDFYMPPAFDWHLSDFVKRGIDVPDSVAEAKARLDHFAQTTAKIFFTFGAPVHGFNVFDKWAIGRGKDWFTLQGWKGLGKFGEAMRSVSNQDATQRELGEHGMNMLYLHNVVQDVLPESGRKLGMDMTKNAWAWDPFAKQFGITTPQLMRNMYRQISTNPLWWFTDVLGTQRFLELKGQGLNSQDAVKKMQHSIDSYVLEATTPGLGVGPGSRLVQKFLSDPSVSWFTAFHQHTLGMMARMGNGLLNPKSTLNERADAAAQMALLGAMLYVAYPALSAGYASLTDNKHAEFERRGISRVAGVVGDIATGKKGYEDIARNVWTPSSVADTAMRAFENKTFSGKPIMPKADYRDWRNAPKALSRASEFALQQFVSPYKTISTAAERPGATPGSVAQRFAESTMNLKTPTSQAVLHDQKARMQMIKDERQRQKRPAGVLESAANWATR